MSAEREKQNRPSVPQEMLISDLVFLAEQDGPPERELKAELVDLFKRNINLHSAFLVRVRYSNSQDINVALCLGPMREDPELVASVGAVFHKMFGTHEHLDIVFLTPEQQLEITNVAKPFYSQQGPSRVT
jgi:hypothetical protein